MSAAASAPVGERLSVMPLAEARALGEARWEHLRARTGWTSPFASWAWHHAWNATAPRWAIDDVGCPDHLGVLATPQAEWTSMQRWTFQLVGYRRSSRGRMLRFAEQAGTIRDRFSRRDQLSNDSHHSV